MSALAGMTLSEALAYLVGVVKSGTSTGKSFSTALQWISDLDFAAVSAVLTTDTVNGSAGTYQAAANADVRKGVPNGVSPSVGEAEGCIDTNGVNQGQTGILVAGTFSDTGILVGGIYYATGWWDGADYVASPDFPAAGNVYNDTTNGVSGTLTFANSQYVLTSAPDYGVAGTGGAKTATIPTASNVLTGSGAYGVNGTGSTPSYSPDFPDVGNVLNTDTVNSTPGTLTLPATSVVLTETWGGPATYGVAGTGSTPQATLTAGSNVQSGAAAFGKFGATQTPSYATTAATQAADAAIVDALKAGITTTTTITFGASSVTGELNMSLYTLTSRIHLPLISEVLAGVQFGIDP